MIPLPIDGVLPEIAAALASAPAVVLEAPPGAGKTTRVPPDLLARGFAGDGRIVMLEPRRVAARAAARRIAAERGWRVGEEVGWHVRFERVGGPRTRLWVVTEGLLVRWLQDDPFLEGVGVVIVDEFHERSVFADLSIAMLRRVQRDARPDLKIVVMSATLEAGPIAAWLGAAVVRSEGRSFPVDVRYLPRPDPRPVYEIVADEVRAALRETEGDVLAFLPGVGEIRRTAGLLGGLDVPVRALYGDLAPAEQDAVLEAGGPRKVVLATNVAETSVTLPGVTAVVDGGLARALRHDPASGLDRLDTVRISRASADQRAGRAGRVRAGVARRCWTEREHAAREAREIPEIRRVDLAGPALELSCWGEDPATFPWFEAPDPAALAAARTLLSDLGAVGPSGVTDVGRRIARLPVHPRLGRLVVEGERRGFPRTAATAAAALSERTGPREPARHASESDVLDLVEAMSQGHHPASRNVARSRDALLRSLGATGNDRGDPTEALGRAILAAWPDRVARRREPGSDRGVLAGGRGVRLAPASAVRDAALFVCVDVDDAERGRGAEAVVRLASAVDPAWLAVEEAVELGFDADTERVSAVRRRRYRGLVLDEQLVALPRGEAVTAALVAEACAALPRVLPEGEAFHALLVRLRAVRARFPELELPPIDDVFLAARLPDLCEGRRSFAELRAAPWFDAVLAALPWRIREVLDRQAPEALEVPSGRTHRLVWEDDRPPVLAVKIQELFGLAETPRVLGGRVKVLLHLLSPNGRPQQVTDDLRSFWDRTWPEVRKELRARYPKHGWPEDPWTAPPQARPSRKPLA